MRVLRRLVTEEQTHIITEPTRALEGISMSEHPPQNPLSVGRIAILHGEATVEITQWLVPELRELFPSFVLDCTQANEGDFFTIAGPSLDANPEQVAIILLLFFDGHCDVAKDVFLKFRQWSSRRNNVVLQALNMKRGAHQLYENRAALMETLKEKLAHIPVPGGYAKATASGHPYEPETAATFATAEAKSASSAVFALTAECLRRSVQEGQGEVMWLLRARKSEFPSEFAKLHGLAANEHCGIFPVTAAPREIAAEEATPASPADPSDPIIAQEFVVRQDLPGTHIEIRLAMCGNVDSGKSTLTSVLTRGMKDDGRGSARALVFNHRHEMDTGRTSSISENTLGFDAFGGVVNYPSGGPPSAKHQVDAREMSLRSAKIITLYDLAGHEKYLKTTVLGMTRNLPDYACVVISANNGIQRMTKEHLGLCLALKLPLFVVITRVDATPENVTAQTFQSILKLLKMPTVRKVPYVVKVESDAVVCAKNIQYERVCPIFEISNVTGQGIPDLIRFINMLPVRKNWAAAAQLPREMVIDGTFYVPGVGTVVGGIITQGTFTPNETVLLGPDSVGAFRPVQIKSIHVKGVEVEAASAGSDAAMCLRKEKRNAVRKGNVLVDAASAPKAYWQFEGEIVVLYHATTIATNYEPVIHSQTVRQSARITLLDNEILRTGDRALARFQFLYRPEFIKVGQRVIFREGRTKGIGTVMKLLDGPGVAVAEPPVPLGEARAKEKEAVRGKHKKR